MYAVIDDTGRYDEVPEELIFRTSDALIAYLLEHEERYNHDIQGIKRIKKYLDTKK